MPIFEASFTRKVTERVDVEFWADTAEDAQAQIEADVNYVVGDAEAWVCDCQDEWNVWKGPTLKETPIADL